MSCYYVRTAAFAPEAIASEITSSVLTLPSTWPAAVGNLLGMTAHLLLGTYSDNMADRAMRVRMPSATAARWRGLPRAERSARSR